MDTAKSEPQLDSLTAKLTLQVCMGPGTRQPTGPRQQRSLFSSNDPPAKALRYLGTKSGLVYESPVLPDCPPFHLPCTEAVS